MSKDDGYLHVASFVHVVWYPKELYPKGIKTYDVAQGDKEAKSESKDEPAEE